jgi:hypothetical protein
VVDEHSSHRLSGKREEMLTIRDHVGPVHQTEIRLMDQCRGLQRMLTSFASHVTRGEATQFGVQDAHHSIHGIRVALTHLDEQRTKVGAARHKTEATPEGTNREARILARTDRELPLRVWRRRGCYDDVAEANQG